MSRDEQPNESPDPEGSESSVTDWLRELLSSNQIAFVPAASPAADWLSCAHCNSECSTDELTPGVFETTVYHDDPCPWLAQLH